MSIRKSHFSNSQSSLITVSRSLRRIYSLTPVLYFLLSCSSKPESKNGSSSIKFEQYYLQGQQLYQIHCSNCHQKTGTGLGLVYPPLHESDFIDNNVDEVICIIKYGKSGELIVNGKKFNKTMPAFPSLSMLEVAEIATYICNTWSHNRGLIDIKAVDKSILNCSNN